MRAGAIVAACAGVVIASFWVTAALGAEEEFAGPFKTWKNVKTDYGAKGDGKSDDTVSIQKGLDELRVHAKSCVLYFPAGTYRITKGLVSIRKEHQENMGTWIVGEDPANTTILWDGPEHGTMLLYAGWYAKIGRLALDGAKKADYGIIYTAGFSTYNETSDMIFRDMGQGLAMGKDGEGQAENAVLRCKFLRCGIGIQTHNFNAMDIWTWYCTFEDCDMGLFNGAGNFHVYESLFLRSKKMDIGTTNLMVFSFVNNTSIGSRCFMDWRGGHTWGAPTSITGNRIIDPTGDFAMALGNGGPYLVAWNTVRSRAGVTTPQMMLTWGDQALVGNTWTVKNPVKPAEQNGEVLSHFVNIDEKVVGRETIDERPPTLPGTPAHVKRTVYELSPGADDSASIQKAVDQADLAVRLNKGQRAVVHLGMGVYNLKRTVTVPAGCDVSIVGDGAGDGTSTVVQWAGPPGGWMFGLEGPTRASMMDMQIKTASGNGILVAGCDQKEARILANQLNVSGSGTGVGVWVNELDHADVRLENLQGGSLETWLKVTGGKGTARGAKTESRTLVFCGATGTSEKQYVVEKGGRLVVRSVYHEVSGKSPQAILLNDSGSMTIDATRYSYATTAEHPLVLLDGFKGTFGVFSSMLLPVGTEFPARIETKGNGAGCKALSLGNMFWSNKGTFETSSGWKDAAEPKGQAAMRLCNINGNGVGKNGFARLEDAGTCDDAFVREMLEPLRTASTRPFETPKAGTTDLYMRRVLMVVGTDKVGVELRAAYVVPDIIE
jgi:hypothetical protein